MKPHLEGYAVMSAYADKKTRPRRWTTGFSPGGAISIAYLKQYLRHSGRINRADLSDMSEDLV